MKSFLLRWREALRRQRKFLTGVVVIVGVVWPIAQQWLQHVSAPLAHPDESAWIFYTHYYHLAFVERNFDHPDWRDKLALHHPPLGRYIFGAALALNGLQAKSNDDFRWWQEHDMDYADQYWKEFWGGMKQRTLLTALVTTRTVATVFALLACAVLFLIGRQINPVAALAAPLLLAWSPLLRLTATVGEAETMLLFFLLVSVWIGLHLAKKLSDATHHRKSLLVLCAAWGVACALAFSVKINGLLGWMIGATLLGWLIVFAPDKKSRAWRILVLLGGTLVFLSVTFGLNPTLWSDPLGSLAAHVSFRAEQMAKQREFGFFSVFPDWHTRVSHFLKQMLFTQDFFWAEWRVPLGCALFAAGALAMMEQLRKKWSLRELHSALWVTVSFVLIGCATLYSFFVNWARYLVPLLPWVVLVQSMGIIAIFGTLWARKAADNRWQHWLRELSAHRHRWVILAATTLALAWFCHSAIFPLPSFYAGEENRYWKGLGLLENTVKRHPHNRTYRVQLAISYQQNDQNRPQFAPRPINYKAAAEQQWAILVQHDPAEEFPPCTDDLDRFFREAEVAFPGDQRIRAEIARHDARCRKAVTTPLENSNSSLNPNK